MLIRVKQIIGPTRPVTVPQIWIDGKYVGGADAVARYFTFSKRKASVVVTAEVQP